MAVLEEGTRGRARTGFILLLPLGTDALTDPVTDPGPNPSSDTAIWRRIFQSSYIREQYVLTHCSASPEPGPGSAGSSESPGSQGPGSPEGSVPPDPPSQQGCRSLAWGEPAGSRSCPLPPPPVAPVKVRFNPHPFTIYPATLLGHLLYAIRGAVVTISLAEELGGYICNDAMPHTGRDEHRDMVLWGLKSSGG